MSPATTETAVVKPVMVETAFCNGACAQKSQCVWCVCVRGNSEVNRVASLHCTWTMAAISLYVLQVGMLVHVMSLIHRLPLLIK